MTLVVHRVGQHAVDYGEMIVKFHVKKCVDVPMENFSMGIFV